MSVTLRIIEAAKQGDSESVIKIASESNPFVVSSSLAETALLTACEYGQLAVVRACVVDLKCNPNCVDRTGRSPLHRAVQRKENGKVAVSILKYLTGKGAKLRKSVLHVCCNDLAIHTLLELKADVNAKSVDNLTPIEAAVSSDKFEVACELIRGGCRIDPAVMFAVKSASMAKELVRAKIDINVRNSNCITPLQKAVESGDKRIARCLLEAKADPSMVSRAPSVEEEGSTASSAQVSRANSISLSLFQDNNSMKGLLVKLDEIATAVSKASNSGVDSMLSQDLEEWADAERILSKTLQDVKTIQENIEKHNRAVSASSVCVVCRSRTKSVVLMPCKHLCCCAVCLKAIERGGSWDTGLCDAPIVRASSRPLCPLCRMPFDEAFNVFT
jgi:ankyrin repeat protein